MDYWEGEAKGYVGPLLIFLPPPPLDTLFLRLCSAFTSDRFAAVLSSCAKQRLSEIETEGVTGIIKDLRIIKDLSIFLNRTYVVSFVTPC